MVNDYKFTIIVDDNRFFRTTTPPSYTSRDDDDDDDEGSKSCFKSPKNRVCYSLGYQYRGIRYLVVRVKTLMGLRVVRSLKFFATKNSKKASRTVVNYWNLLKVVVIDVHR